MSRFDEAYREWMSMQIEGEQNARRRELLQRGLSHSTVEFLRLIWFPAIGSLDHLFAEFEVRDLRNAYRYLDLAYLPGNAKGSIEIQDFSSHARDVGVNRFKDLCMKQSLLALDDWTTLTIAFLSVRDDPGVCKQLVLSFVGKFLSNSPPPELNWAEAETLRFANRFLRPISPKELADHLQLSLPRTRSILHRLLHHKLLVVAGGKQRYRTFRLPPSC